jgi:predicted secreted hydrolase
MNSLLTGLVALLFATFAVADEGGPPSQLADLLAAEADAGFAKALEPRAFVFPADHGPHSAFRNEWWYVTGNLDDEDGRRFGFELTIFRFALAPSVPESESRWRSNQVYIAHLAITHAEDERFYVAQRYSRAALGLAGAQAEPFHVWIDDWAIAQDSGSDAWQLHASDTDFGIDVELQALAPPVLNGIDGLSQMPRSTTRSRDSAPRGRSASAIASTACPVYPGSTVNGARVPSPPTRPAGTGSHCSSPTAAT